MIIGLLRNFTALAAIFSAVLVAPACDEQESTSARLSADAPTNVGLGLELGDADATLELADGTRLELGLSPAQRDSLAGVCDSDARVVEVALRPLALGERELAAPVLAARCAGEAATAQLTLRDSDEACEDGECASFVVSLLDADGLLLSAPPEAPQAACQAAGTQTCVACGGGKQRTKVITTVNYDPNTGACTYGYTYGTCINFCPL